MENTPKITPEALLAHSGWVRRLVSGLVFDPSRTEDVLQETWLVALKRPPRENLDLRAWLATVARNVIKNLARSESRRRRREEVVARVESLPDTPDVIEKARLQGRMVQAVLALEEPYRTCVLLRFFEELPPREIAARLGRPVNTVRTQVARGLDQLRSELDAEYGDRDSWGMAFLPLLHSGSSSAVRGSLLLKTGGLLMFWKLTLPVAAIAIALSIWSNREVPEPSSRSGFTATSAASDLTPPNPTNDSRVIAIAGQQEREAIQSTSPEPEEHPAISTTVEGRAVDIQGRPLANFALRFEDTDHPTIADDYILVRGERVDFTPELERLYEERTPASRARFLEILKTLAPPLPTAITGSDGSFSTQLLFANVELIAEAPNYRCLGSGLYKPAGGEPERLYVFAQAITLEGRVVNETGDRLDRVSVRPSLRIENIPGFPLLLEDGESSYGLGALTNEEGEFAIPSFPNVPGARIEFHLGGYETAVARYSKNSNAFLEVVMRAEAAMPQVTGQVFDAAGLVAAHALVTFGQDSTVCDEQGWFAMDVTYFPTQAVLLAFKPGFAPAIKYGLAHRMQADPKAGLDQVLHLGKATGSISGKVVDEHGDPVPDIQIYLRGILRFGTSSIDVEERLSDADARITDSQGRFTIEGLFGESYDLVACAKDTFLGTRVDNIAPGTTGVVLVLDSRTNIPHLRGRVIDRNGRGVPNAKLSARITTSSDERDTIRYSDSIPLGQADSEGRFELHNVPTKEVSFLVSGSGIDETETRLDHTSEDFLTLTVALRLRFQLDSTTDADFIEVQDEDGTRLTIQANRSRVTSFHDNFPLHWLDPLPTFEVSDAATQLVFFKQDREVRRIPLDLRQGEITRLR